MGPPPDAGCDSRQTCGCRQSSLGENKGPNKSKACCEERWNYSCRAKAAFPVDESSMGGKKKKRGQVIGLCSREDSNLHGLPHTVLSRTRLPIPPREQNDSGPTMRKGARAARSNQPATGRTDSIPGQTSPHASCGHEPPVDALCAPGQETVKDRRNSTRQSRSLGMVFQSSPPKS
jgi:hypothetical protein